MGAFQRFFVGVRAMPKWRRRKHNICSTKEPGEGTNFFFWTRPMVPFHVVMFPRLSGPAWQTPWSLP